MHHIFWIVTLPSTTSPCPFTTYFSKNSATQENTFYDVWSYVPCAPTENLDVEFDGISISVPLSEYSLSDGTDQCVANIGQDNNILGELFLRHAYVVYDI